MPPRRGCAAAFSVQIRVLFRSWFEFLRKLETLLIPRFTRKISWFGPLLFFDFRGSWSGAK